MNTTAPFLSRRDVADMLGVDIATVDRWSAEGVFVPKVRLGKAPGGKVGFSRASVEEWIATR